MVSGNMDFNMNKNESGPLSVIVHNTQLQIDQQP